MTRVKPTEKMLVRAREWLEKPLPEAPADVLEELERDLDAILTKALTPPYEVEAAE